MGTLLKTRRWMLFVFMSIVLIAASGNTVPVGSVSAKEKPVDYPIAVSDQASRQIIVYDPDKKDWSKKNAVLWKWSPSSENGFADLTPYWGLPTEGRVRYSSFHKRLVMAVTDSRGLAALIPFPEGDQRLWGLYVGGNPHAAEVLPDGNIAVASSTGGWVRVYTASQGSDSSTYAEYRQTSAHGATWDPVNEILWTIGNREIAGLKLSGTADRPELTLHVRLEVERLNGHDIQPVLGDPDRLWVASGGKVYQYIKSTNSLDLTYPGVEKISRVGVKAVGSQWSGQVVETVTDYAKTPRGGCTMSIWCTETVDFFSPDVTRTVPGAAFYKARILNPFYY